jgi:hypothetical protein
MTLLVRQHFFTPRLRFKNLDELNAWLLDRSIACAEGTSPPETYQTDSLGGVRGRTTEARFLCRPVRRIPRDAGIGLEDISGALRRCIQSAVCTKFGDAIDVLYCFQKKTQKTSKADLNLAGQRYWDLLKELGQ